MNTYKNPDLVGKLFKHRQFYTILIIVSERSFTSKQRNNINHKIRNTRQTATLFLTIKVYNIIRWVLFNALLGYIGVATSGGMERRMIVLSDINYQDVNPH